MSPSVFPVMTHRSIFLWVIYLCLVIGCSGKAEAHLVSGFNIRVVHFERQANGITAYFRLSLPLVVANGLGQMRDDQSFEHPAPYTFNRRESGRVFHYVDEDAVRQDTPGLGRLVADGHRLMVAGKTVQPRVLSVRVHPKGFVPPFNTLDQVRTAVHGPAFPDGVPETEVSYVLVDVALFYQQVKEEAQFQFASLLTPGKMGEPDTNNMLFDHKVDTVATYTIAGLLDEPITVNPSLGEAVKQFLTAGCIHILEGWDHLLFIVCLVIGDFRLKAIAIRITGFSVGHSLSLVAGFYGWTPGGLWFPPMVEVAIAFSIFCAAMLVLFRRGDEKLTLPLTVTVGLVHGFGFAFGLREMLAATSQNLIPSLLSFNLGVELGQLLIAFSCWSLLFMMQRMRADYFSKLRVSVAVASTVISVFWLLQRVPTALSIF